MFPNPINSTRVSRATVVSRCPRAAIIRALSFARDAWRSADAFAIMRAPKTWAASSKRGRVRDVFIVGVGQTPVSKETDVGGRHRAAAAVKAALADAGVEPDRVGALYVGNMMSGLLAKQQQLGGLIADYAGPAGHRGADGRGCVRVGRRGGTRRLT